MLEMQLKRFLETYGFLERKKNQQKYVSFNPFVLRGLFRELAFSNSTFLSRLFAKRGC